MQQRIALCLALLACAVGPALAARPFVTDDARVVDEGGCQVETFVKKQRNVNEQEFWFLPACNPFGVELTAGHSWVNASVPGDSQFSVFQAKTLLKTLQANGSGYALTVGAFRVSPFQAPHTTNPFVNAIGSFSFVDDRLVIHANIGAIGDRQAAMTRATWGLGAEITLHPQLIGILESYGQRADKPTVHYGLRVWVVPNRVQVDGTIGTQHSGPPERAFRSLGLRVLF